MTTSIDLRETSSAPQPGEHFHTALIEQLVGELYADTPDHTASVLTAGAVPAASNTAPGFPTAGGYPPPHGPVVGAHTLSLPSAPGHAAAPGIPPALSTGVPSGWLPSPFDAIRSAIALPSPPGAFTNDPAGALSPLPPVHPHAPATPESSRQTPPAPTLLDEVLHPKELYQFGEPRFQSGQSPATDSASPLGLHHRRLDSSQVYYFLRSPAAEPTAKNARHPDTTLPAGGASELRVHPSVREGTTHASGAALSAFDVQAIRRDFPALHQTVNGKPLVWLDNAATTHKPQSVIDITSEYYSLHNSNIHRAAHTLAARSTDLFEGARDKLRDFVGAASSREIVFVRGTTEAINLVANSYGQQHIRSGDEIIVTEIEHHANIVPWQLLAQRSGAVLRVAPVNERGELILERFAALLGPRTKLVSVTHVANALGTINPVEQIIALAHARGVPVLVDAAQSSPHIPIDVRALDADFLVLSGHKVFGPTGIGILYGKEHLLDSLPPWQGGGHMIKDVTFERTVFNGIPEKFEAGTPDIAGAVGLGAAVDYLRRVGLPAIAAYEHALLEYTTEGLSTVRGLRLIGTAAAKASVLSFVIDGYEPEQVSRHLDKHGIATRSGHHCAQPALRHFGLETTVRASLAF